MSESIDAIEFDFDLAPSIATAAGAIPEITSDQFFDSFGESLDSTLDIDSWRAGMDLSREYARIELEVRQAVEQETEYQTRIRETVFPKLGLLGTNPPPGAGLHLATVEEIEDVHKGLLFNGGVEACDGTTHVHDTLPLTIFQIGVSLVSYAGNQGTWHHRLYRRDLRFNNGDPIHDVLELLERRGRRGGLNHSGSGERFSQLFQRAVMAYAERAILLRHSKAVWRMGHGTPAPLELLTGAGMMELMVTATRVVRDLVRDHQRFVFVASEPAEPMLSTIGQALHPLEFAIVISLKDRLETLLRNTSFRQSVNVDTEWDGQILSAEGWIRRFIDEIAPQVVVGVFRASALAPAQIFYAHASHADVAARIAIADSALQQQRGFPMLIDLADQTCRSVYGGGSLTDLATAAYAAAGTPFRYLSERTTR